MADSNFDSTGAPRETPWPTEAEIELERRLLNIEQHQSRTNQLLMQLQVEYRNGINEVKGRIDNLGVTVATQMGELSGLMKKFLANGH
jgi:hypothetical protein